MKRTMRNRLVGTSGFALAFRLTLLLLFFTGSMAFSVERVHAQVTISVQFENFSLAEVLALLKEKSGYEFLYNDEEIGNVKAISGNFKEASLHEILETSLVGTGYTFRIVNNLIVITPASEAVPLPVQEEVTVNGKVVDEEGTPLPGVTVMVKGQKVGVATDIEGTFAIGLETRETVLVISFVGMLTQEIAVKDIREPEKEFLIVMKPDVKQMEEVVVTGYVNIKKNSFTGTSVTVSKDELMKVSKTNVMQALQAFDPSFRIQENNAMGSDPNTVPELYIRGRSGIGVKELDKKDLSKSALQNNPNLPTFIMDGFQISVQKLYDMDPNRIESITILKDAAATAMYGSRAANGVVVITTVAPKPGKVSVNYNLTGTLSMPDLRDYNLMNARQKLDTETAAGLFRGDTPGDQLEKEREYNEKLKNVVRGVNTYWLSKPLRTVFNHKHSLFIDGGTEDIRFGVDLSYNNDDGVMRESYRNRMSAGLYLDYRVGSFQIRNQVSYGITNSENSPYGSFSDYTKKLPYDEYKDENGKYLEETKVWRGTGSSSNLNPLYEATLGNFTRGKTEELINNLSANWYINDYWLLKGQFSITKYTTEEDDFLDPKSRKNDLLLGVTNVVSGELSTSDTESLSWDANVTLSYNRSIKKHNMNFTMGMNATSGESTGLDVKYRGFPSGELSSPNYAQEIVGKPLASQNKTRLFGVLGSFNYTYDNIYLADLSVRTDGSSEFGADKRFAPFWSGGLGINIHNYEFLKEKEYIDILKIRGSYGITGKVNFSPYEAHTIYKILNDEWYKTGFGATLMALGNRGLGWEKTKTFDVGMDIQLFRGAIQLDFNYYRKKTIDLVNSVTIPSSTGFTTYMDNIGEVMNKGFEIQLKSTLLNRKDWFLAVYANLAHNKNKILKISESLKAYNDQVNSHYDGYDATPWAKADSKYSQVFLQYVEGGSLTSIFGMRSLGINPADGREIYLRKDGSVTYDWNASDQVVLGDTEPEAQGSFGFNLRYKNITLYTTFLYEFGGQRYNSTLVDKVENARISSENVDRRVLSDRWQNPGDVVRFKKLDTEIIETTRPTSRFVQDYNVLTFNSFTLGYDFGPHILKKTGLGMLRLEVGANDIFRISSVKAERGLDYPYARTMNVSLKASF